MATVAPTTPIIITTTLLTMTPDTTGTPAPWYRAAPILPIAPSVTSPTTRRQGRISAAMVGGILAHKSKKRAAQAALYARHFPCSTIGRRLNASESGRWPVSLGGCGFGITCGARGRAALMTLFMVDLPKVVT